MKLTLLLFALMLSGCAMTAPNYTTSFDNVTLLRQENLDKVKITEVTSTPGPNESPENITMRASPLNSPYGSYAGYLREALTQELKDARLLDENASKEIKAYLLKNSLLTPMSTGSAELEARFVLSRGGSVLYDKTKSATVTWPSAFLGATALSSAQINYPKVYQKLLQSLFTDIDFLNALKPSKRTK